MKLHLWAAAAVVWAGQIVGGAALAADKTVVIYQHPFTGAEEREGYYIDLLKMALTKTEATDGPFEAKPAATEYVQGRLKEILRQGTGEVQVAWFGSSAQLEADLQPVRFPLLKGLLGHRIFIIRAEDQAKFSAVQTLDDLKKMAAGQGVDWADTAILKAGGINVVGAQYEPLFKMLSEKRFDWYPRAVHEPYEEVEKRKGQYPNLTVETDLMLVYKLPMFFFTSKKDAKLADRIYRGLELAFKDGSFDKYFAEHPVVKASMEKSNFAKRRRFTIDNPNLTPETAAIPADHWLKD